MEKTSYAPGDFCWTNLATSDWKAAKQFYTSLFRWTSNEFPMGDQPHGDDSGSAERAKAKSLGAKLLVWEARKQKGAAPTDCDSTATNATSSVAPADIPNAGRFAVLADPQGAPFAIIRLTMTR